MNPPIVACNPFNGIDHEGPRSHMVKFYGIEKSLSTTLFPQSSRCTDNHWYFYKAMLDLKSSINL